MKSRSRDGLAAKGLFGMERVDTVKLPMCKAHILLLKAIEPFIRANVFT